MNTETITIAGAPFVVPAPYTEGHAVTAGEAAALNQLLHENGRNNLARKAKATGLTQDDVDGYFASYQFGIRQAGAPRKSKDPVQARAMEIAKEKVMAGLRAKGQNPSSYKAAAIAEAAAGHLAKHPEWTALAAQQIADEAALADDDVELPVADASATPSAPKKSRKKAAAQDGEQVSA